jgi:hypothetical protein
MLEPGQDWQALATELKKKFLLHTHCLPVPTPLEQTRQVGGALVSSQLLAVAVQAQSVTAPEAGGEVAPAGHAWHASPLL